MTRTGHHRPATGSRSPPEQPDHVRRAAVERSTSAERPACHAAGRRDARLSTDTQSIVPLSGDKRDVGGHRGRCMPVMRQPTIAVCTCVRPDSTQHAPGVGVVERLCGRRRRRRPSCRRRTPRRHPLRRSPACRRPPTPCRGRPLAQSVAFSPGEATRRRRRSTTANSIPSPRATAAAARKRARDVTVAVSLPTMP